MSYATPEDVRLRYGTELLDSFKAAREPEKTPAGEAETLESSALEKAPVDASGLMDSYLNTRYPLPLQSHPDVLKRFCIDIALYWLADHQRILSEEKHQRYEDALQWLKQVQAG